jgi:hypothetical protein
VKQRGIVRLCTVVVVVVSCIVRLPRTDAFYCHRLTRS